MSVAETAKNGNTWQSDHKYFLGFSLSMELMVMVVALLNFLKTLLNKNILNLFTFKFLKFM
jgi:hypothetical protein